LDADRSPLAQPLFIGSGIYRGSSYGRWHPLRVPRVPQVIDLCRALCWLDAGNYRTAPRALPPALTVWHTPEYVAALQAAEAAQAVSDAVRVRHGLDTASNPIFPEMFRRPATGAGGVYLAAGLLQHGGVVHCPGGGTHHGLPDRASGFCFLNDPVLAVLALRRRGVARVAYVDLDAHHGDGVELAFRDDPDVLLVSVHEENRWPRTGTLSDRGVGNVFNLPVPPGLNDSEMAEIRERLILRQVAAFRPDAIVVQCGADSLLEDPLSRLALSNRAYLDNLVGLRTLAPRLLVLGGGGYNPWTVGRLWTLIWGTLAGRDIPDRLPPAAVAVLAGLGWSGMNRHRPVAEHWTSTLLDAPRPGPVRAEIKARLAQLSGATV
jgi:acetoin utilization protein AcuC